MGKPIGSDAGDAWASDPGEIGTGKVETGNSRMWAHLWDTSSGNSSVRASQEQQRYDERRRLHVGGGFLGGGANCQLANVPGNFEARVSMASSTMEDREL